MKVTFRISPGPQYEYVEIERELEDGASYTRIAEVYAEIGEAFKPRPINELPPKEWDTFLENWLLGESNHTETIEKLSPVQKATYNVLKRAKSRINSKLNAKE